MHKSKALCKLPASRDSTASAFWLILIKANNFGKPETDVLNVFYAVADFGGPLCNKIVYKALAITLIGAIRLIMFWLMLRTILKTRKLKQIKLKTKILPVPLRLLI
ncbi:hypothetical protein GGTG_12255 [Gaeumannomyces tritici R3-111a-1]|uniref:Uncharacterized protein n=1 Tax=Gaeumannomyces tritici (strain R3-111a-1) TaxID=644352 RepID=J3PFI0_GAET3|nr:hypothetical protein GGTG_12255 [Gaeumannomyces tritici R3-111a-1]EJT70082.1 hypothetical protein GGTG_12255 [Gaeumannomyces tritici R3-111a-1]